MSLIHNSRQPPQVGRIKIEQKLLARPKRNNEEKLPLDKNTEEKEPHLTKVRSEDDTHIFRFINSVIEPTPNQNSSLMGLVASPISHVSADSNNMTQPYKANITEGSPLNNPADDQSSTITTPTVFSNNIGGADGSKSISSTNGVPQLLCDSVDYERAKRDKVINLLDFMTGKGLCFVTVEGIAHHFSEMPGNWFECVIHPFFYFAVCAIMKRCLLNNVSLAVNYSAFILNLSLMIALIEHAIFLNATRFEIIFVYG